MLASFKRLLVGAPRDIEDPQLFHKVSLIAFLAWVGLGSDGLSSSAYGPDEAFRALGPGHQFMAVYLAIATAFTVFVISLCYSHIIEHFPTGGGGYVVATKLLGAPAGVVSGSALLIDYVLTITTSIASGAKAIFAFLPQYEHWSLPVCYGAILILIVMNLRGIKESITVLIPIFLLFCLTHAIMLGYGVMKHAGDIPTAASHVVGETASTWKSLGFYGFFSIFMMAYSRGAGTFTGIEAVSNGLTIMREPRVATGKRTMIYMAISLAVTAGGIMTMYYITGAKPEGETPMNAILLKEIVGGSAFFGNWFVVLTLIAEALLLLIAAQTGFIDGPRVMANMALDSWLPHRFSALSERLTTHYGVLLIGAAALLSLWYTNGSVDTLVTMYSINVFITFSLSLLGMCRFYAKHRQQAHWKKNLAIQMLGLVLCVSILSMTVYMKFQQGAWVTVVVTALLVALCAVIRMYYKKVYSKLGLVSIQPDELTPSVEAAAPENLNINKPTAVLLVGSYGGLGIHSFTQIRRLFPNHFQQIVFVSVGVIDSGNFKGSDEIEALRTQTQDSLDKYVALARKFGMAATSMMQIGNEAVEPAAELCIEAALRFRHSMFFAGNLVFQKDTVLQRVLHNQTAAAIQNRLQWLGYPMLILPIRVWGEGAKVSGKDLTKSTIGLAISE